MMSMLVLTSLFDKLSITWTALDDSIREVHIQWLMLRVKEVYRYIIICSYVYICKFSYVAT